MKSNNKSVEIIKKNVKAELYIVDCAQIIFISYCTVFYIAKFLMFFRRQVFCHRLWKEMYDICGTMLSNGWQYFKFAFFCWYLSFFCVDFFFCLGLLLFTLPFFRWCLLLSSAEPSLAACLIPSPRFSICWPTNKAQFNWKLLSCHLQQSSEPRIKWSMW